MTALDHYLITPYELRTYLKVSIMSIKRYEKRGWIKPIRINTRGDRRYTREEVLRFLAERGYESQNL